MTEALDPSTLKRTAIVVAVVGIPQTRRYFVRLRLVELVAGGPAYVTRVSLTVDATAQVANMASRFTIQDRVLATMRTWRDERGEVKDELTSIEKIPMPVESTS